MNAAFTLQTVTWTTVIYYRGSVLITYLQYLTLASETWFSLSIKIQKKKRDPFKIRNVNPKKRMGSLITVFKAVFVSNEEIGLHSVCERKKLIHI